MTNVLTKKTVHIRKINRTNLSTSSLSNNVCYYKKSNLCNLFAAFLHKNNETNDKLYRKVICLCIRDWLTNFRPQSLNEIILNLTIWSLKGVLHCL